MRDTAAYIAALTGSSDTTMTWQTYDDKGGRRELARILHGAHRDVSRRLEQLSDDGAGIFACVNETDLRGRKAGNVRRVRALFVDVDDGQPRTWHLEPSILVQSAGGPHAYWCVDDCDLAAFEAAQRRLSLHYASDPRMTDLCRVLRVPGYRHRKGAPVWVDLVSAPGTLYRAAAVLEGIAELPAPPPRPARQPMQRHPRRGWRSVDAVDAFGAAGLLGRVIESGKYAVTCPWTHEHTRPVLGEPDGSSVLWSAVGESAAVYHCSHAHCQGRYLVHALREIGSWT